MALFVGRHASDSAVDGAMLDCESGPTSIGGRPRKPSTGPGTAKPPHPRNLPSYSPRCYTISLRSSRPSRVSRGLIGDSPHDLPWNARLEGDPLDLDPFVRPGLEPVLLDRLGAEVEFCLNVVGILPSGAYLVDMRSLFAATVDRHDPHRNIADVMRDFLAGE
jgi:hypothetical protein